MTIASFPDGTTTPTSGTHYNDFDVLSTKHYTVCPFNVTIFSTAIITLYSDRSIAVSQSRGSTTVEVATRP